MTIRWWDVQIRNHALYILDTPRPILILRILVRANSIFEEVQGVTDG